MTNNNNNNKEITLTMTKDKIVAGIKSIRSRATKLQNDIHIIAVQAMLHAQEHDNDFTLCTELYNALPKGVRKQALKLWFEGHAPMILRTVGKDDDAIELFKKNNKEDAPTYMVNEANSVPFWKFTDEQVKLFSFDSIEKAVRATINRARTKVENEELEEGENPAQILDYVSSLESLLDSLTIPTSFVSIVDTNIEAGEAFQEEAA